MVSFLAMVTLMLFGMMFLLVMLLLFLIFLNLMKRVWGTFIFLGLVFMVDFLVVSTFLMMTLMVLVMLNGAIGFWFILFEPLSESLGIVLLFLHFFGEFLLLVLFMMVFSMDMMLVLMGLGMFRLILGEVIGTANSSAISWVLLGSVFIVEESISGTEFFLEISFGLGFLSSGCLRLCDDLLI